MKRFKRFLVSLLAMALLCGTSVVYVSAAENQAKSARANIYQDAQSGDASVTFTFSYSDGNSVKLVGASNNSRDKYNMPNAATSSFSGDTCYATAVLVNKATGAKVTLKAWCDIYGESGSY